MKTSKLTLFFLALNLLLLTGLRAQNDNARYISQSTPGGMDAGKTYGVSITMKNIGRNTWYKGSHSLRLINVPDAYLNTWGVNKVDVNSSVSPGEEVVFNFTVTAPDTVVAGGYTMQWQMANGNAFFGEPTMPVPISVSGISEARLKSMKNGSMFTSQKVPTDMDGGQIYNVSITVKNTGGTMWKTGEYKLKVMAISTDNPELAWVIPDVDLPTDVVPGSDVTLVFKVTAPNESGVYNFQTQLAQNGAPFGESSTPVTINVN